MRLYPIITLLLLSCNVSDFDSHKTGLHKVSRNSAESKANGVFQYQVKVDKPIIRISSIQIDTIQEAWVESSWQYQTRNDKTIIQQDSMSQLAILFKHLPTDSYNIWIKQGNKNLGWSGVAVGTASLGKFFIVESNSTNQENIIDSFTLTK